MIVGKIFDVPLSSGIRQKQTVVSTTSNIYYAFTDTYMPFLTDDDQCFRDTAASPNSRFQDHIFFPTTRHGLRKYKIIINRKSVFRSYQQCTESRTRATGTASCI